MTFIVGIDCASQDKKAGLALGEFSPDHVVVHEVIHSVPQILPILTSWTREFQPILFAFDAPLGWPAQMGHRLHPHSAGESIPEVADNLFSRLTDRTVRQVTGKKPLEVGADRIARTALRALNLLGEIRADSGLALPLPLEAGLPERPSAIEVYPATALMARGLSERGYKGRDGGKKDARRSLLRSLGSLLRLQVDPEALLESDDGFDAVVCLICAMDFLNGEVLAPVDLNRAAAEGWIWFNARGHAV